MHQDFSASALQFVCATCLCTHIHIQITIIVWEAIHSPCAFAISQYYFFCPCRCSMDSPMHQIDAVFHSNNNEYYILQCLLCGCVLVLLFISISNIYISNAAHWFSHTHKVCLLFPLKDRLEQQSVHHEQVCIVHMCEIWINIAPLNTNAPNPLNIHTIHLSSHVRHGLWAHISEK